MTLGFLKMLSLQQRTQDDLGLPKDVVPADDDSSSDGEDEMWLPEDVIPVDDGEGDIAGFTSRNRESGIGDDKDEDNGVYSEDVSPAEGED